MSTFVATSVTAEVLRLRATRSTGGALLAALAFTAVLAVANVLLAGHQDNAPLSADTLQHAIRAPGRVLGLAMLLVGVLAAAGEYRHGTVLGSLLAQPRRRRWVLGKAAAVAVLGLTAAAASTMVAAVLAGPLLASHHAPAQDLAAAPLAALSVAVLAVGYGVIGVALGLLLRNQAAALTVALIWQFVVEGVLPVIARAPGMVRFLPGGAADAAVRLGGPSAHGLLPAGQGVAVFTAYAVGLLVVALTVSVPRDVS